MTRHDDEKFDKIMDRIRKLNKKDDTLQIEALKRIEKFEIERVMREEKFRKKQELEKVSKEELQNKIDELEAQKRAVSSM